MKRHWLLNFMAFSLVIGTIGLLGWIINQSSHPMPTTPAKPPLGPSPALTTPIVTSQIAPSQPVELYIPSHTPALVIHTPVAAMPTDCRSVIDPPRDAQRLAGVYTCQDFSLPGTTSSSLTVIAGHAGQSINTEFNKLYQRGLSFTGQTVFLRTIASGDKWLVYTVQDVYQPAKNQLPYLTAVWGKPGQSTAGRLVLITCDIADDGTSTHNYVAVLQLEGVT